MTNCSYCGTGNKDDKESCQRCGAPLSIRTPFVISESNYGTCVCGMEIDDGIRKQECEILCGKCHNIFKGTIKGKYDHDRIYPNGQLAHVYKVVGLQCPYCGIIFVFHEFYHGVYAEQGIENFIKHVNNAKQMR